MDVEIIPSQNSQLLTEAIADFLFHCRYEKGLNEKTIIAYRTDLKQLYDFLRSTDPPTMTDVSKDLIKAYLQRIACFKPKTVKRKIASMKAFFSFYEFEHDSFINPFRKIRIQLKEPHILPTVMCKDELNDILRYLYQERNCIADRDTFAYKTQTRDIALIELLFATGMRVSELCHLQCNEIDLMHGTIKIYGKGSKERIVQVCAKPVLNILKEYQWLWMPTTFFFINRLGNELSAQSVRLLVKRCVQELHLTKHITPHTFRHTFATLLLEEEVDIRYIQHLLGHANISTTQIYTHVNLDKQRRILQQKHPRNKLL